MKNPLFQAISVKRPKTNLFDLSHEKKISMDLGNLVPILVQEVVPGDKFKVNTEILLRLAPMVAPMMHRVNVFTHYFFVPNRLVMSDWEDFITGGEDGVHAVHMPHLNIETADVASCGDKSLWDYMGSPSLSGTIHETLEVNALPFRGYHLIWNEFYRDQTLSSPVAITKNTTVAPAEQAILLAMRKRCWEKDYFTSALTDPQRGGAVNLPLVVDFSDVAKGYINAGGSLAPSGAIAVDGADGHIQSSLSQDMMITNVDGVNVSVNDLRRSSRLQEWLEKNARGGSRYAEALLTHFGVISDDAQIQRPLYLGGGRNPVVISEVVATSAFEGASSELAQGNMAGHGISVGNVNGFSRYFKEHGFIIGILSVIPRSAYQEGIEKHWLKFDKFDYYWPEFANIGEQAIENQELFYNSAADAAVNRATWGYQSRYAEYKFRNSMVHGDFRTALNYWHMGRILGSLSALNSSFVTCTPDLRPFALDNAEVDHIYAQLYNSVKAIRPMPVFGTPTF